MGDGRAKATGCRRVLARVWSMIYGVLDSDADLHHAQCSVTWMASHGARNTIGIRTRSDGLPISSLDWRANRLADAAAKAAAASVRVNASTRILHNRIVVAYERALCELAAVTVAANRHEVETVGIDGITTRTIKRDSLPAPRQRRRRKLHAQPHCEHAEQVPSIASTPATVTCVVAARGFKRPGRQPQSSHTAKRRRMERDHVAICDHRTMDAWRKRRAECQLLPVSSIHGSAADRLASLRTRVVGSAL